MTPRQQFCEGLGLILVFVVAVIVGVVLAVAAGEV